MDRRRFVSLTVLGATAVTLPGLLTQCSSNPLIGVLSKSQFLAQVCDEKELIEIGKSYLLHAPAGTNELVTSLTTSESGTLSDQSTPEAVYTFLNDKIKSDFKSDRILVANGWVLSITEARQCAIYSLIQ